jgi:parvulin-like peptidyl-prolyl isomerase
MSPARFINADRMPAMALLLFLGTAPARAATPTAAPILIEDTVATVNGAGIMLSDYQKEASSTIAYVRRTNPAALADPSILRKLRENTLEELITRELLVQAGKRAQLTISDRDIDDAVEEIKSRFKEDPETGLALDDASAEKAFDAKLKADGVDYAEFRQSLMSDIMARKVIAKYVTEKTIPASEEEVRAYFDEIQAYLTSKSTGVPAGMDAEDGAALREAALQVKALSSEGARVELILVRVSASATENELRRALKTAQALKKRLDEGQDFEKLAREESEDPESAAHGGDIGYIVRGAFPPELEKAAFSLPIGRTSDPFVTDIGCNIIRVTERRAAQAPRYDLFKNDLKGLLDDRAQKKMLRTYLRELRGKAVIERHLPPSP